MKETEQELEPHIAEKIELSNQKFRTTMINMLRALIDKVDNMQEYTGNVSRGMKIQKKKKKKKKRKKEKKKQKEVVEQKKKTVAEVKNDFDGLIHTVDMTEKRISNP